MTNFEKFAERNVIDDSDLDNLIDGWYLFLGYSVNWENSTEETLTMVNRTGYEVVADIETLEKELKAYLRDEADKYDIQDATDMGMIDDMERIELMTRAKEREEETERYWKYAE
jgi:hypothetical protein